MRMIAALVCVFVLSSAAWAAQCERCNYPAANGTLVCWACGSHLPGAPHPSEVIKLDLTPVLIKVKEKLSPEVRGPRVAPDVAYEAIKSWIKQNPKKYDEAIAKLEEFLVVAKDTGLERAVVRRISEVKEAKANENKPMTTQERMKAFSKAYPRVMKQIRAEPDRVVNNIKLLEGLLKLSKGTHYEPLVKKKLEVEKAKSPR